MTRPSDTMLRWTVTLFAAALLLAGGGQAEGKTSCLDKDGNGDLIIDKSDGLCNVPLGATLKYRHVHILNKGVLNFQDGATNAETHFWARAIIVEDGGTLTAGTPQAPFGANGGKLVIHLWGKPEAPGASGVACKSDPADTCGTDAGIWYSNMDASHNVKAPGEALKVEELATKANPRVDPKVIAAYKGPKDDYFYGYHELFHDEGDKHAYFGYKVLGVSAGGTLKLFGKKGAIYEGLDDTCKPTEAQSTGRSWTRLAVTANKTDTITVQNPPCGLGWAKGDKIVVTTTDYLPGHSEEREISADPTVSGTTVVLKLNSALTYIHNGKRFPLDEATNPGISRLGLNTDLATNGAETRAAVALLSRSIRIVSEGINDKTSLPAETSADCTGGADPSTNTCYFGGHTVFRQGFQAVQIQGVEFYQMGQGGRLGHYPVHFHHARKTQNAAATLPETFVKDSSVWDSMNRWIVLHGTQDVTLARNVGYKSIGHGFYLEDATEINNKLFANVGIFARAAVENVQNPRKVPGILAAPNLHLSGDAEVPPFKSDYDHPSVFWITNAWNDFQYNMAAGAGTCGVCYWLPNTAISTMSRVVDGKGPKWESYAAMQSDVGRVGMAPLKSFIGNSCTSAMTSFQTVTITTGCTGLANAPEGVAGLTPIKNPIAGNTTVHIVGPPARDIRNDDYYPLTGDGGLFPTQCPAGQDCSTVGRCGENNPNCMITVLDRYTTSFNWAAFNFAAVWLRPQWYLVTDSVFTDAQQAGLTMVTGGGYDASSVIPGHWAVVRKSVFIGNTQDCPTCDVTSNAFASNGGPFNPSGLSCALKPDKDRPSSFCLSAAEGISIPVDNFGMYQRLFSVYDGPAFQDSNAYLNIKTRTIDDCTPGVQEGAHICVPKVSTNKKSVWLAGDVLGLPKGYTDPKTKTGPYCFMPNAAIGWKQPNGFYYPPAFHSRNLFFKDVDIRHFVLTPLFVEGTFKTDTTLVDDFYCKWNDGLFNGFTSIDRQTVLNDDDGSLTGYRSRVPGGKPEFRGTTVVNDDAFFNAPVSAVQCRSDETSKTSPFEYVTTVVYPACAITGKCAVEPPPPSPPNKNPHVGDWDRECTNESCYGVPLWRLDQMPVEDLGLPRSIRMAGQKIGQRSTLTVNHGTYYMDTTPGTALQFSGKRRGHPEDPACPDPNKVNDGCLINVFKPLDSYYIVLIFAKEDTEQTYRFYVGPGASGSDADPASYLQVKIVQSEIKRTPLEFGSNVRDIPKERVRWFKNDKSTGIVEVVLKTSDLVGKNNETFAQLITKTKVNKCLPTTYCHMAGDKCVDASGSDAACGWAIADPDCPEGGCFGIRWTMPSAFQTDPATDPLTKLLPPDCLKNVSPWDITLADPAPVTVGPVTYTPSQVAGDCFQAQKLLDDFCKP